MEKIDTSKPVIVEKLLNSPVEEVWQAITDKEKMKLWYFNLPDFKPEVGNEFRFSGGPDGREYIHICKVTEVVENKKIAYSWLYEGYEGMSIVTFELFAEGKKTKIRVTHEGLESFPASNSDFARTNFEGGWSSFITEELPKFLEKN